MEKIPGMFEKISPNRYRERDGMYYEDFTVGDTIEHSTGRTLIDADCIWMALLDGIQGPLHINRDYAKKTEFGDMLVDVVITLSIVAGLHVRSISSKAVANLELSEVVTPAPVKVGDTLYAETEILSKRESKSRPTQGIVKTKITGKNQDGTVVITFTRTFLVWKRTDSTQTSQI